MAIWNRLKALEEYIDRERKVIADHKIEITKNGKTHLIEKIRGNELNTYAVVDRVGSAPIW